MKSRSLQFFHTLCCFSRKDMRISIPPSSVRFFVKEKEQKFLKEQKDVASLSVTSFHSYPFSFCLSVQPCQPFTTHLNVRILKVPSYFASTSALAFSKIMDAMVTKGTSKEWVLYPFSTSISVSP